MTERRLPQTAVENLVEDLASKTNADLSNLDATGQAKFDAKADTALTNSPYTTNRILEIPQDIKLELNNGTLTLKAGSKVYVPNGFEADGTTPKFDVIVTPSDYVYNADFGFNHSSLLSFDQNGSGVGLTTSSWYSGTSAPTSDQFMLWYDTNANKIKWTSDSGSTWIEWFICLPIARITIGDAYNIITSIDQIFNGFGYIGSTVFALPGVKVQAPNGRNADGTYKSISKTVESVLKADAFTNNSKALLKLLGDVLVIGKCSVNANNDIWFDEETGYLVRKDGNDNQKTSVIIAYISSSTNISSFTPYNVDSIVNSNLSNLSAAGEAKLKSNIRLVNELPANPEPGVLYCIPEA